MASYKQLLLVALVAQMLCATVLGYSKIAMNRKSNITIFDRHDQFKRGSAPLGGGMNRVGFYYVELQIGSQIFQVDIDTGSSTLFVVGPDCHYLDSRNTPCTYAKSYYQGGAGYQGCDSGCSDCQKGVCIMHATYGDGSQVYGAVKTELVAIGGYSSPSAPVAISYYQSSNFAAFNGETFMDGLWGLAYPVYNGGQPTVLDRMVSNGMPNIFSMCFHEPATPSGSGGGYFVLGGIDTTLHTGQLQYTSIVQQDYYNVAVTDVRVDGAVLNQNFPGTFIDSGTTFTYIPVGIYNAIRDALINKGMDPSFFMTPDQEIPCVSQVDLATMPNLDFLFPEVGETTSFPVTLGPMQYTILCDTVGYRAFGIIPTYDSYAILGDTFMQASHTVFDRANNQIGFAPVSSSCTGFVSLNTQFPTVPGTKSQFSDVASFLPSLAIVIFSLTVFLFMS